MIGSKFSLEEAIEFLNNKLSPESSLLRQIQEEIEDDLNDKKMLLKLEEATGFIPYELEVVTRLASTFPDETSEKLLERYYSERIPAFQEAHYR